MNRISILLLTTLLFYSVFTYGQTSNFKTYTNHAYRFSFEIPSYWTIIYSKLQDGLICMPLTKSQKENYKDCFEGIVFRLEIYKSSLDSTLLVDGLYTKKGDKYYTMDRSVDSVKCKNIRGKNWTGIYHDNICGVSCNDSGIHPTMGRCEFIYFSNRKTTICINTNGREFDDDILKRLIKSFKLN